MRSKSTFQLLLLVAAFLAVSSAAAQSPDVKAIAELEFSGTLEEQLFHQVQKSQPVDYLDFFLASDPMLLDSERATIKHRFNDLLAELEKKKIAAKPVEKAAKIVFQIVQDQLLEKYMIDNLVSDVFLRGEFNCVSASALYAMIFEHFGIPYSIQEEPTHVYVIVDPEGANLMVEGTDPQGGYTPIDRRFKSEYVDMLVKTKLISKKESEEATAGELFERYYVASSSINLLQLVALQYHNQGVSFISWEQYEAALPFQEKAYALYPNVRMKSSIISSKSMLLDQMTTFSAERLDHFVGLYSELDTEELGLDVVHELFGLSEQVVIANGDTALHRKAYLALLPLLVDSTHIKALQFIYHYQLARFCVLTGSVEAVLPFALAAKACDPDHVGNNSMLQMAFGTEMSKRATPEDMVLYLDSVCIAHPALCTGIYFQNFYAHAYLFGANLAYELGERKRAEKFIEKGEAVLSQYNLPIDKEDIARTYGAAWRFYCREADFKAAREYVNRGLKISPDNTDLRRYLGHLDEGSY